MDKVSEIPEKKWTVNDSDSSIDLDYLNIAEEACSFIEVNEVLYINSGTSGNLMCRYLPHAFRYSVVTNSVRIADELSYHDNIDVYVLGGKMRCRGVCDDMMTLRQLEAMRFDKGFLTGYGVSSEYGLSNTSINTAALHKTVIENSISSVVLVPSYKIGRTGFSVVDEIEKISILITNKDADKLEIKKIKDKGIKVILV